MVNVVVVDIMAVAVDDEGDIGKRKYTRPPSKTIH
jgi:hypothetical protein